MLSWKERFPRSNEGLDLEIQLSVVGGQLSGQIASWNDGFDWEIQLSVDGGQLSGLIASWNEGIDWETQITIDFYLKSIPY